MIDWSHSKDPRSTQQMMEDFANAIAECVVVPNSWLAPYGLEDKVRGGRTLARIDELQDERDGELSQHKKDKQEKAIKIEIYRKQYEQENRPDEQAGLDYVNIDEYRLYNNQMLFAQYCPSIELDD
jgi:hypothetical protein